MNLTPSMGASPGTIAAALGQGEEPRPLASLSAPLDAQAPPPVDLDSLLTTFAIGAQSAGLRAKASAGRKAFSRLAVEAAGAAATLRALGQPSEALERAIAGVGFVGRPELRGDDGNG